MSAPANAEIAAALGRFFHGGTGPSHTALTAAFAQGGSATPTRTTALCLTRSAGSIRSSSPLLVVHSERASCGGAADTVAGERLLRRGPRGVRPRHGSSSAAGSTPAGLANSTTVTCLSSVSPTRAAVAAQRSRKRWNGCAGQRTTQPSCSAPPRIFWSLSPSSCWTNY